jgi:hypothetical protein
MEKMTGERWDGLSSAEKEAIRDNSGLSPQLVGREGYRVEVETTYGEKRRFIVGKSTGWKPCHVELFNRRSWGGFAAEMKYKSVRVLYYAR